MGRKHVVGARSHRHISALFQLPHWQKPFRNYYIPSPSAAPLHFVHTYTTSIYPVAFVGDTYIITLSLRQIRNYVTRSYDYDTKLFGSKLFGFRRG